MKKILIRMGIFVVTVGLMLGFMSYYPIIVSYIVLPKYFDTMIDIAEYNKKAFSVGVVDMEKLKNIGFDHGKGVFESISITITSPDVICPKIKVINAYTNVHNEPETYTKIDKNSRCYTYIGYSEVDGGPGLYSSRRLTLEYNYHPGTFVEYELDSYDFTTGTEFLKRNVAQCISSFSIGECYQRSFLETGDFFGFPYRHPMDRIKKLDFRTHVAYPDG